MRKSVVLLAAVLMVLTFAMVPVLADEKTPIMIQFSDSATPETLAAVKDLCGKLTHDFKQIHAAAATVKATDLEALRALPGVKLVEKDGMVKAHGEWTWDLDMINIEAIRPTGSGIDGSGVYVAVIDTGLVPNYLDYFPSSSIATEFAMSFHNPNGNPNPGGWRDTESHGTHVTSTILGYSMYGTTQINGVAPAVKVIPVKVLNNKGSGYDSAVIAGILYVADLKKSGKITGPVVINMSLGGPDPSAVMEAALDYAIAAGVAIVCSAGNEGDLGMGYPGAYPQVISVGACGWVYEWYTMPGTPAPPWWRSTFVTENPARIEAETYVAGFSSREKPGQQLDVLAPGSWVVGPYLVNGASHPPQWSQCDAGQYYYLGGTSMASPHVAGTVALMLQKNPRMTQAALEAILKGTACRISAGTRTIVDINSGQLVPISWGSDAVGSGLINAAKALDATPLP